MIDTDRYSETNDILEELAGTLDVPPSKYVEAKERYDTVGSWLDAPGSPLQPHRPAIYPQGSFALGTVVRPIGDEDYDVDTVCLLQASPRVLTQRQLKDLVGDRLKTNATYAAMIDPADGGRRCWTLQYAEASRFHLDILPAIPDAASMRLVVDVPEEIARHAIRITDKTTWHTPGEWPKSNPLGYVAWFKNQMEPVLFERKQDRARTIQCSVSSIQDYEVRTPLQQAIQILKRHRDVCCSGDEDKPISIIITTLAAQVYQNQRQLLGALTAIVPKMRDALYRQRRGSVWWVANPANPEENFADKWADTPRKAEIFLNWVNQVESDLGDLRPGLGITEVAEHLTQAFGARESAEAMKRYAERATSRVQFRQGSALVPVSDVIRALSTFVVAHRAVPHWPQVLTGSVTITGSWRHSGGWHRLAANSSQVLKGSDLRFRASTTVQPPYEVSWQVVNTGRAARAASGLRGGFYPSDDSANPLTRSEGTAYRGRHWVECFIVKNGVCVARSGEFVVYIV